MNGVPSGTFFIYHLPKAKKLNRFYRENVETVSREGDKTSFRGNGSSKSNNL